MPRVVFEHTIPMFEGSKTISEISGPVIKLPIHKFNETVFWKMKDIIKGDKTVFMMAPQIIVFIQGTIRKRKNKYP
jgi:hypothetical protein